MKPILDRTKSKAEAYAPGAAPKGTFPSPFQFSPFLAGISETACCGRRSGCQPPFDARFGHERSLLATAFFNRIYVVSIKARMSALVGGFNRSTQHLLILRDGEVCDGRECTDMVYAEAEG